VSSAKPSTGIRSHRARRAALAGGICALLFSAVLAGYGVSGASGSTATGSGIHVVSSTPAPTHAISSFTWDSPFGEPTSLDPIHNIYYAPGTVLPNLCDQLYWTNPVTLQPEPDLAVSYSQPNPLTLVYKIRRGVKFWDGHPVTAADVAYSLNRNANPSPKLAGGLYPNFEYVKSITATGPYQVTIKLTKPDELLPKELAAGSGAVYEEAYAKSKGASFGTATGGLMCSGPFKLVSWKPGTDIVMGANPDYWNKALEPKVKTVTIDFITDPSALTAGLLSGAIDGTYEAPTSSIPELESTSSGHLYFGKSTALYIDFPLAGLMLNPKIRAALSLVIDRPAIAKTAFFGAAQPALAFAPPSSWGSAISVFQQAYSKLPGATPNVAAAKKLFAEAGSPKTAITFGYLATNPQQVDTATIMQADAAKIGMNIKLVGLTPTVYENITADTDIPKTLDSYDGAVYYQVADPFDEFVYFLQPQPGSYDNYINYTNSTVDHDFVLARQTYNDVKRAHLEVAAQQIYQAEDTVEIPLVNYYEVSFANAKITGFPTGFPYLFYPWAAKIGAAK
jgi:peptide/nickel transport system substrate-binding protein